MSVKKWEISTVSDLALFVIGGDWGKDPATFEDDQYEKVNCIRGSEIKKWNKDKGKTSSVRLVKISSLEKRKLRVGDILIEISGGGPDQPVGRTVYIDKDSLSNNELPSVCTNFLRLYRPVETMNSKFLQYYFKLFYLSGEIIKYQGGSNNLRNLKYKEFERVLVPFPSLAEQNRIVAKLDILFKNLEKLDSRLDKIPVFLKRLRQSILTEAVVGKLTKKWKVGKEWEKVKLIDIILEKPRNGYSPKGVAYETPVKSLSLSATTSGKFDPTKVKYLDIDIPPNDSYLWLKKGDILIQRSNSLDYVGTSAIYSGEDNEFIYPDIMMKVKVSEKVINTFLDYCLKEQQVREYFKKNATGTAGNMPKINQGIVMNTPISLPSIEEQKEIVAKVKFQFTKLDRIEEQYRILKSKIELLPQAILAKAFRGELVEQLPTDGDAKKLLKEIKKLKVELLSKSKKKRSSKKVKKKEKNKSAYPLYDILLNLNKACGEEELKILAKISSMQFIKQVAVEITAGKIESFGSPLQYKIIS